MTKTYIKPNTDIIKIELQQMIADSPNGTTNGLDPNETSIDPQDIDAKSFSFFEEEIEEE